MITTQERTVNRTTGGNPVVVTRNYAKARMGDQIALRWLIEQSEAGNVGATRALVDLAKNLPKAGDAFIA